MVLREEREGNKCRGTQFPVVIKLKDSPISKSIFNDYVTDHTRGKIILLTLLML